MRVFCALVLGATLFVGARVASAEPGGTAQKKHAKKSTKKAPASTDSTAAPKEPEDALLAAMLERANQPAPQIPVSWRVCEKDADCIQSGLSCGATTSINRGFSDQLHELEKKTCGAGMVLRSARSVVCKKSQCELAEPQ